jgi:hypothetical protein
MRIAGAERGLGARLIGGWCGDSGTGGGGRGSERPRMGVRGREEQGFGWLGTGYPEDSVRDGPRGSSRNRSGSTSTT